MLDLKTYSKSVQFMREEQRFEFRKDCVNLFNEEHPDVRVISIEEDHQIPRGNTVDLTFTVFFESNDFNPIVMDGAEEEVEIDGDVRDLEYVMNNILKDTIKNRFSFDNIRDQSEMVDMANKYTAGKIKELLVDKGLIFVKDCAIHVDLSVINDLRFLPYLPIIFEEVHGLGTYDLYVNNRKYGLVTYYGWPEKKADGNMMNLGVNTSIELVDGIERIEMELAMKESKEDNNASSGK